MGRGVSGRRLAPGVLGEDALPTLVDAEGVSALEARARFLADLVELPRVERLPFEQLAAHVEIHVEQRGELLLCGAMCWQNMGADGKELCPVEVGKHERARFLHVEEGDYFAAVPLNRCLV